MVLSIEWQQVIQFGKATPVFNLINKDRADYFTKNETNNIFKQFGSGFGW